jgi:hypothetical protein
LFLPSHIYKHSELLHEPGCEWICLICLALYNTFR